MMKQRYWKLSIASEPEGLAVGEESTHGALQGILAGRGGGHGVVACGENVQGVQLDEGAAREQGQAWVVGSAEGQHLLGLVRVQVGVGGRAEGQLLLGQVLVAVGKVLVIAVGARKGASRNKIPSKTRVSTGLPVQEIADQGLSVVDNKKEVQGFKRDKTVEVAKRQCQEMVVVIYIYKEDEGHEVDCLKDVFKSILSEGFSSLNFSLGDVAHAALCSRVLAARGSLAAGASASYGMAAASSTAADQDLVSCC